MELDLLTPVSCPPSLEWGPHTAQRTHHSKVLNAIEGEDAFEAQLMNDRSEHITQFGSEVAPNRRGLLRANVTQPFLMTFLLMLNWHLKKKKFQPNFYCFIIIIKISYFSKFANSLPSLGHYLQHLILFVTCKSAKQAGILHYTRLEKLASDKQGHAGFSRISDCISLGNRSMKQNEISSYFCFLQWADGCLL
jgi:hypothetical protein